MEVAAGVMRESWTCGPVGIIGREDNRWARRLGTIALMSTTELPREAAHAVAARDHEAIMRRLVGHDFPWDYQRSLIDLGFAKGLIAPRVAGLIAAQGYFQAHLQKRYDDTSIILIEIIKHGYSSERGA